MAERVVSGLDRVLVGVADRQRVAGAVVPEPGAAMQRTAQLVAGTDAARNNWLRPLYSGELRCCPCSNVAILISPNIIDKKPSKFMLRKQGDTRDG